MISLSLNLAKNKKNQIGSPIRFKQFDKDVLSS